MPRLKNARVRMNASEAAFSPAVGSTPFGRWLMAAREFHGVSLDEVAQRSGVAKSHLSNIENKPAIGDNLTLAVAEKITRSFGMPLWQVLKRIGGSNAEREERGV
jgi:transcriptional regulator with XRE-family HTH domain